MTNAYRYFSPAVATPESRLIFVNNILATYIKYDVDGIDIDWEYPGQPGNPGNIVDTEHDTANYLLFLQLLRQTLPPSAKITAATLTQPWVDASGQPSKDMTAFATVLDWVLLMNYDVWGSSANPGPNAPLSDGCGNSTQPGASADAAVRAWTAAGFPANKLTLGLPSYGYVSKSRAVLLHGRTVALTNEDGSIGDGQIQFRELIHQGALIMGEDEDGTQRHIGTGGYTRHWDECSSTPFLRSAAAGRIITYDDPKSIAMKADLARQQGLLGVNMFDVHGDTDEWHLIDAARNALFKN
jgi:chitinase